MIPKVIEAVEGETWIHLLEYPDETIALQGIFESYAEEGAYRATQIRFSWQAIKAMLPLLQEWVDEKEANS